MSKPKHAKSVIELLREKQSLIDSANSINMTLSCIPCSDLITAVCNSDDFMTDHADQLVELLKDRDEPMTRYDIIEIFEYSGFEFNASHIDACNPDTEQAVIDQIAYYRD